MHWFWRAVIAIGAACLLTFVSWGVVEEPASAFLDWLGWLGLLRQYDEGLGLGVFVTLPAMLVGLAVYGLSTQRWGPRRDGDETRCRKCGYILRGISEPRCPECGERI